MRRGPWLALAAVVATCSAACTRSSDEPQTVPPRPADDVAADSPPAGSPIEEKTAVTPVQMTFVGQRADHPPLRTLFFDVVLDNEGDRPRWFVLPSKLGSSQKPIDSSAFAVEVFTLAGSGEVLLGRFMGAPGFQALHLPAGGQVTIRGFAVKLVGTLPPGPLVLEAVVGDSLTVGGEPAEDWFQRAPTTALRAEVKQAEAKMVSGREAPDLKAVPVSVGGARRLTVTVPIDPTAP